MKSKIKIITRNNCVIVDNSPITNIYTVKDFPILASLVDDQNYNNDLCFDINWAVSEHGTICLKDLIDPAVLYGYSHNPGGVGKIWANHHQNFFEFINQDSYKDILEVGGASGLLVEKFLKLNKDFTYILIEPAFSREFTDSRIHLVKDFVENYQSDKKFDTVIHSHTLEHMYEPINFLNKLYDLMPLGGHQYISIPNLTQWMENNFCSSLTFEHTYFIDDKIAEYMLNKTGFIIVEKHINDHSIFIKAKKVSYKLNNDVDFSYVKNIFQEYINRIEKDVVNLKEEIGEQPYFIFGGTLNAQFLLKFGLKELNLVALLDNDVKKQNKRLYGTRAMVYNPNILKDYETPLVIVRSGPYTDEIKNGILQINPTTKFL